MHAPTNKEEAIYQFIIMSKQQISDARKQIQEEGMDAFQEFKEEYMTYSLSSQITTSNLSSFANPNKPSQPLKQEKAKLKMIESQKSKEEDNVFANYQRSNKKTQPINSRVISIGSVIFRSNFQSGNISQVNKVAPNTYQIFLNQETNSQRVSAWFHFICEGLKGETKFIIKGFRKTSSLFNQGMKICYKEIETGIWRRGGTKISYTQSYSEDEYARKSFELRFTYFFKTTLSTAVEFAYCFPYTYSDLLNFLSQSKNALSFQTLGKTYLGRDIPLVTIGNQASKQVIFVSARAHPGQTVGSWMMQGFLKELTSENQNSRNLRQTFLFKIVPMINVDGVIEGNYRFSGSGFDLNRKWKNCKEKYHPEVYLIKEYILSLSQEKEILMFIDFHGHSRQKNVFFYGCCPKGAVDAEGNPLTKPKQFPFLMSKIHAPFRYDYCSYGIQKDKQGTARITMWKQLKIDTIYTIEASFCGSQGGQNYQISDYQKIGSKLCYGMSLYFSKQIEQNAAGKIDQLHMKKLLGEYQKNITQFYENPALAEVSFEGNSSDSEPQAGQIPEEQRNSSSQNIGKLLKYHKGSKFFKINEKSYSHDQEGHGKDQLKRKYREQKRGIQTKSFSISKAEDLQRKPQTQHHPNRKQIKTTSGKNTLPNYSLKADLLQKTVHEKLHDLSKAKNNTEQNGLLVIGTETTEEKYESEQLYPSQRTSTAVIAKKKTFCFEGAQYRRVRKLAEEHNRRLFSVQQINQHGENSRSFVDMNNILEIDQIKPKYRAPSFFPNATNSRAKNDSIELHFRKQIKAKQYTSRRFQINGINHEVRTYGKKA